MQINGPRRRVKHLLLRAAMPLATHAKNITHSSPALSPLQSAAVCAGTRYDLVKLKTHRPNGPPKVPDPYLSGTVVYVSEARVSLWQASVLRLKGAITIFTITVLRVSLLSFALRPRCFERSSPSCSPRDKWTCADQQDDECTNPIFLLLLRLTLLCVF